MQLALRRGANKGSKWYEKIAAFVIEQRLVTIWPHCGMVIRGDLYHATAKGGLIREKFKGESNWDLYYCGDQDDQRVIDYFHRRLAEAGGKVRYDWFSLLAFTPAIFISKLFGSELRHSDWLYCYEWCLEAMTEERAKSKVTAEILLKKCIEMYGDINNR